ncbi:MAG: helix-turn-helix domain-containing protein [Bdellovibrionales bacterium]|nr:helix-turn-helix domain-containing protein [Bdellovibrionales bacterium]
MKKDEFQQEFDFVFDSKRQNSDLSKKSSISKVKEELPKVQKEPKVRTASDESSDKDSEGVKFFGNRIGVITVEELAVFFGLAPQTIRNWVAQGKLPYVKIGKRNMFLQRSVQEWINRKEEPQWQ